MIVIFFSGAFFSLHFFAWSLCLCVCVCIGMFFTSYEIMLAFGGFAHALPVNACVQSAESTYLNIQKAYKANAPIYKRSNAKTKQQQQKKKSSSYTFLFRLN